MLVSTMSLESVPSSAAAEESGKRLVDYAIIALLANAMFSRPAARLDSRPSWATSLRIHVLTV
jgi:hypothetical protein